jgi:hypothetical protein
VHRPAIEMSVIRFSCWSQRYIFGTRKTASDTWNIGQSSDLSELPKIATRLCIQEKVISISASPPETETGKTLRDSPIWCPCSRLQLLCPSTHPMDLESADPLITLCHHVDLLCL